MSLIGRLGLAIVAPRDALAIAGNRRHAGRSGSDLLAALTILVVATELRWIVQALWLGGAIDATLGLTALVHVLTGKLAIDLGLLAVAAAIIAFAGLGRDLGRAFDLACVAVLPLVFVDLATGVICSMLELTPPPLVRWGVLAIAGVWTGWLVVTAAAVARGTHRVSRRETRAGWIVVALAVVGVAVQLLWITGNPELVRPQAHRGDSTLAAGTLAPAIALPRVGPAGALGERVSIARGKLTILDFWATWCGPCREALPALDEYARAHPDVDVLTINLDDPVAAREIFDREHYALTILADDGTTSARYGVEAIPHEVLIGTDGMIVADGSMRRLAGEIARLRH